MLKDHDVLEIPTANICYKGHQFLAAALSTATKQWVDPGKALAHSSKSDSVQLYVMNEEEAWFEVDLTMDCVIIPITELHDK